ncbi:MAG: hypothetical protein NXI27_07595 [Alphaproteobacteria bacterium]|nr:hypothetical protein [Alphaproteobacteria bacterium]
MNKGFDVHSRQSDARRIWSELKSINPDYPLERKINSLHYERKEDRDLLLEGIRKAEPSDSV